MGVRNQPDKTPTERQLTSGQLVSPGEQHKAETMASVKPDPAVPKVDAPGEYRIRRLHRGIAPFELVGKEGVDNVHCLLGVVPRG